MNREYHKWWSPRLERQMELLVFGHSGTRVLVFPTRGGRFFEYENLGLVEQSRERIEAGELQLYCVDSVDAESFYCWWAHPHGRMQRHIRYENYILDEVFPLMELKNPGQPTISHGCSLGAFHAANIAFRHPQRFQKLVAFSGRYDLTLQVDDFRNLFDGYYCEDVFYNTPTHFLPGLDCDDRIDALRKMDITLVIGDQDPFRENNEHLSQILWDKGIWHGLRYWNGRAHRGRYWREMAPQFLTPCSPLPLDRSA
ncbi:esterase family protein [Pelagicoccus mobilis]|uniref:Esterase family protein n=1 Tax=Pelagicoccus mobilis TaxID=415221 RepID=A0A934VS35_9BACT|nr:alpha/beta hydrolase-fold protein [Pelagicoccus mobilis]MBK1878258.1 esterase family protein [Pelagicoccus mobilis]